MEKLSVIICTYNPDPAIFSRCLRSVSEASKLFLPSEIFIIDNNSTNQFTSENYISEFLLQNSNIKILHEEIQGLTAARLRGIRESTGELLVFIDDDNVLLSDFFKRAIEIFKENQFIGAFSGRISLEFQNVPPAWTRRYWGLLVQREFKGNRWTNLPLNTDCMPAGAGLCITRSTADFYYALHETGKRKILLDRNKDSLLSGGDNDLAMCACDLGLGMGVFEKLQLIHVIPQSRTTKTYLLKLAYSIYYSAEILKYMRNYAPTNLTTRKIFINRLRRVKMKKNDAQISKMCDKGIIDALKWIRVQSKIDR